MSQQMSINSGSCVRNASWIVLSSWFVLALGGSLLGAFQSGQRPLVLLGLMAGVPVLAFAIAYRWSDAFRQFVLSANPRWLTAAQSWRVLGAVFVILYYRGMLPGTFALPAGWGDIAVGVTAPLVAWAMPPRRERGRAVLIAWNLFGILDLVTAVTLGILCSNTPVGILASGATTQLMGSFPLSLIPTFLVPLFLIFHILTLMHLRGANARVEHQ